uniref:Peptidase S1 domain-containing protein n=1 Tax=Romanomermis culicivorax TaxID=13658 RepID=A0A915J952_ROMCU
PAYDGDPEHGNDLAVLKLKEPIKYDRYVTPIKFPVKYTPYSHADCFTTGWETFLNAKRGYGREKSRDKLLQRFDVDILDDKKCGSIWGQLYNNKSAATYCAALKIRKSYLGCKVDHGSPLTCFENGGYVLYGLANIRSLHKNCKRFDYTHLGVKIPYVLTWIYGQDKLFASPRSPSPAIQQSPPTLNRIAV